MATPTVISVIISSTSLPLWGNRVPDIIYKIIKEQGNIQTRKEVENLCRHDCIMLDAFCSVYGECLERCEFAILKGLPYQLRNFYKIIQIPLYRNILNTESIEIQVDECLSFYKNAVVYKEVEQFIRNNTNRGNIPPMTPFWLRRI